MKRRHQVVLFAVLLLSLTILSPSFDFRGSQLNQERDQEKDTFPGSLSRNEDAQAPLEDCSGHVGCRVPSLSKNS